jgi:uridine kinase
VSLEAIVDRLLSAVAGPGRALVAIDGVGASGKTTLAARLAERIGTRPVVVLHVDDFFQPSATRHARGRLSPEGFWLDAYNYGALVSWALTPLGPGGSGLYRPRSFDAATDAVVKPDPRRAPRDALVLVEGTFLHRDELRRFWDCSIYLDVPVEEATRRMTLRDGAERPMDRYLGAQKLYAAAATPWERATLVVDNADPARPRIVDASTCRTASVDTVTTG